MMPDLDGYEYIINLWHEAGTTCAGAMGCTPLTWNEIESYTTKLSLELSNWELLSIRRLSIEYCGEYHQASDINRPAPFAYEEAEEEIDREAVANKIKNLLRARMKRKAEQKYEVEDGT